VTPEFFVRAGIENSRDDHIITLDGKEILVDNVTVSSDGIGSPIGQNGDNNQNAIIRNCKFICPSGSIYWYANTNGMDGWLFQDNQWDISGWSQLRNIGNSQNLRFINERGNLWGLDSPYGSGRVEVLVVSTWRTSLYRLVDDDGSAVTDSADIRGVMVQYATNTSPYAILCGVTADDTYPIATDGAVTVGDYVRLSATAGKVEPNGTTGSTTKPTSGFIGRVRDVGTASAGAGNAIVEVIEWNRVSATGTGLAEEDIDTLSELNAILTDATLVDTGDSRFSDARTPVTTGAHTWSQTQSYGEGTLTDGANISWNAQTDPAAKVTLAGNRTLDNPTNLAAGATYVLRVIQDATGSRTLAYGSAFKWPGGSAPTLSTAANAVDVLTFYCDGTSLFGVEALAFA
jgi:hypothetical protein